MTAYTGFAYPFPEFYKHKLSSSLDAGLDRPHAAALSDLIAPDEVLSPVISARPPETPRERRTGLAAVRLPTWPDYLFGNILLIPPRLDLGNLLSSQQRSVEIANLYLVDRSWTAASSAVVGLTLPNLPAFAHLIRSFGSFILQVGISADGPPTIAGNVELDFDVITLFIPVTGKRVVIWQFAPLVPIQERLEWKTDAEEAWDGTEQRITLRAAPRQVWAMQYAKFDAIEGRARALLFDWLPRPFAVPLWYEARPLTSPAAPGDSTIYCATDSGDFLEGNLALVYSSDTAFEASEILTINPSSLVLSSQLAAAYPAGAAVMPMRTAYAKTVPSQARLLNAGSTIAIEFTSISATARPDTSGATLYGGKVLLDDPNLFASGAGDAWSRPVIVNDSGSGRVLQSSSKDRSRYVSGKIWDAPTRADIWRIRRLLHALAGSRVSFFLPSFRPDLRLVEPIGASSNTLRVAEASYSTYMKSRRPFADLRLVRRNGTAAVRRVIGAVVDGAEEVLTTDTPFDALNIIDPKDVLRIEFVGMFRIADDQATFLHRARGDATISINLVSVKE